MDVLNFSLYLIWCLIRTISMQIGISVADLEGVQYSSFKNNSPNALMLDC